MAVWESIASSYDELLKTGDPRTARWFLISSPTPILLTLSFYVAFIKVIGPFWMKNRKPFELRKVLFTYNMSFVFLKIYFLRKTFQLFLNREWKFTCNTLRVHDPTTLPVLELGWWFILSKLVELSDTVFFVLRKKDNHISFLHVFHHTVVPIASWAVFKLDPADYNIFIPIMNTCVHVVMYFYYGVAALGPSIQKYLWWKKYLTILQMAQFVIGTVIMVSLSNCIPSKIAVFCYTTLCLTFLVLFANFYFTAYNEKKKVRKD